MIKMWLPVIALLILFPLGHLVRWEFTPGIALYPQDIIAAILSVIVFLRSTHIKKLKLSPLTVALRFFVGVAFISLLVNIASVEPIQWVVGSLYLARWVSYAGVYFYVKEYIGRRPLRIRGKEYPLLNVLALSGLALAFLGLVQYLFFPDMRLFLLLGWDEHLFRLIGTILDPDFMGILLILTWFLLLGLPLSKKTKIVSLVIVVAALFLTYSRGSYLAWGVGSLVFLGLKRKLKYALIGITAFALILFILPTPGGAGVDLTRTFSIYARLVSWQEGVELFKASPIVGHGFNLLRYKKQQLGLLSAEFELNHGASGIQNSYLFILSTTGIIGLSAFVYLLRALYKANSQTETLFIAKQASLSAISVHALFTTTWIYPWVLLWVWLFLAGSLKQEEKR